jgi:microcin C transport system substrate-binding protein
MWNRYVVPMWWKASDWLAYWRRVKHPDPLPGHTVGFPDIWWFDEKAAAEIKKS